MKQVWSTNLEETKRKANSALQEKEQVIEALKQNLAKSSSVLEERTVASNQLFTELQEEKNHLLQSNQLLSGEISNLENQCRCMSEELCAKNRNESILLEKLQRLGRQQHLDSLLSQYDENTDLTSEKLAKITSGQVVPYNETIALSMSKKKISKEKCEIESTEATNFDLEKSALFTRSQAQHLVDPSFMAAFEKQNVCRNNYVSQYYYYALLNLLPNFYCFIILH